MYVHVSTAPMNIAISDEKLEPRGLIRQGLLGPPSPQDGVVKFCSFHDASQISRAQGVTGHHIVVEVQ